MFTRVLFFFLSIAALVPAPSRATTPKSEALPHLVRLLLRPEAALRLRPIFTAKHTTNPDIQSIALDSSDDIADLLSLTPRIHPSRLRPFLPEHSVVFEKIREHINPSLFQQKISVQSVGGENNELLRTSEEKLSRWFTLQFSDDVSPELVATWCKRSSDIEFAEPVFARMLCDSVYKPNDPLVDSQYALRMMHAFEAWKIVRCDSAIPNNDTMVLADVDIGVDLYHEDLQSAIWHNPDANQDGYIGDSVGWDFAGYFGDGRGQCSPYTARTHGSHTSGIMGAVGNNGIGIAGVAFGSKIMALKGASNFDNFVVAGDEGIVFAADHHAKVINCSWGGFDRSEAEQGVIDYAFSKSSIIVVAGGNNGNRNSKLTEFYPAACNHAFSVTSVNDARVLQDYPTYNTHVAVAAPGERILSTVHQDANNPTGYMEDYGTSMAAPQVSGALGLVWQRFPSYTNRQVMERLRATCDTISGSHPGFRGKGLINIFRAVADTHTYALRLDSAVVVRHSGKGMLRAGDAADVQLTFTNVLDPLSHARVSVEFLNDTGTELQPGFVTATNTVFDLGSLATLATPPVQHLEIQTSSKVPPLTKVYGRLWISDSSKGYVGDYDYFELSINPGYETLDANNITVSFDDKGCIGYRDQQYDVQGDGFVWTKPPSSIRLDGTSILLDGGLIVASDAFHAVNGFGGFGFDPDSHIDFSPQAPISKSYTTPYGAGQTLEIHFSDTLSDSVGRVGVTVDETAYALEAAAAANTVIAHYSFLPGSNTARFNAGLYMDWDIGQNGLLDTSYYNAIDSIFYTGRMQAGTTHLDAGFPVIGMKVVHPSSGALNSHYALRRDSMDGGIWFNDPLHFSSDYTSGAADSASDAIAWALFQTNKRTAGAGDVAVMLGEKNLSFASGQSELTMILGFGISPADVRLALLNTEAIMEGRAVVQTYTLPDPTGLLIWPDPVTNGARIQLAGVSPETKLEVSIWDALGRCVLPSERLENGGRIDLTQLSAGIYTIQVAAEGVRLFRTIVKE